MSKNIHLADYRFIRIKNALKKSIKSGNLRCIMKEIFKNRFKINDKQHNPRN